MNTDSEPNNYLDAEHIAELVYHDEKFIKEFAKATEHSISEFRDQYTRYLLERDETNFRKAGHRIKPVAQMLKIDAIVDEYEHAKTLLWDEKGREELQESADRIRRICNSIIRELKSLQ
ncbi:MAG: taurine dioxygenase [Balneolaceae bacterium]|nr:taurine dioxygenase [Balneolaceae bacterium]